MSTVSVPLRSEIPVEYTWDLASIFPTSADWEAQLAEIKQRLPTVRSYAGHLGAGADALADWLDVYQGLMRDAQRIKQIGRAHV